MVGCGILAFQDFKYREVTWPLFPMLAIFLGLLHVSHVGWLLFGTSILINFILVSCIVLILWSITHFVFQKRFLDISFGLGDLLFLYAFALGFPPITFIYLLVGSIGFAVLAFSLMKLFLRSKTVPLAGLMGVFLIATLSLSHMPNSISLYSY